MLLLHNAGILPEDQTLYDPESTTIVHHVNQALRAHKLFARDTDYIIKDGRIIKQGTPQEIAEDPQVREIYLGENFRLV